MNELWAGLAGALLTVIAAVLALPKVRADARKSNAQASQIEWQTLRDEIDRQNENITKLRDEIHRLRNTVATREAELVIENKALRAEIGRLTIRVQGLEDILRIQPLPPDLKALLDELDKKTAKKN